MRFRNWLKNNCPVPCRVLYLLALILVCFHVSFYLSADFADWFNMHISAFFRGILSKLTSFFTFSLGEAILLCLPCAFVVLVIACISALRSSEPYKSNRMICSLLAMLCAMYSLFVVNFASAYRGQSLSDKLGLEEKEVSAQQLYNTAVYFRDKAEAELDRIEFEFGSSSVMPYSLDGMSAHLNESYAVVSEKYDFVQKLSCPVKYITLSSVMSYTHISGVYTYYTGEANINIDFPDYTIPYTAAHEMSHQRGIAAENEANFMAFLVCDASDDAYIRYSGYVSMYEYLMNALYTADPELHSELWQTTDMRLRYEEAEYNRYFSKYSESVAADISNAVNDTYLKTQGQLAGTKTYGLVVDLAVAYVEHNP